MKVAEAARLAGTSPRMLRYYETEGLLAPERGPNGYRDYSDVDVAAARHVVALSQAGLTLSAIRVVLPCASGDGPVLRACPQVAPELRRQLGAIQKQIAVLAQSADALQRHLSALGQHESTVEPVR